MFGPLNAAVDVAEFFASLKSLKTDLDSVVQRYVSEQNGQKIKIPSKGDYTINYNVNTQKVEIILHMFTPA